MFGTLDVRCEVPEVRVQIRQQNTMHSLVLREPGPATTIVPTGRHTLVFERVGYAADEQTAEVRAGETTRVACRIRPQSSSRTGTLTVTSEVGAGVRIDGHRANILRLPPGPHRVSASFGSARWKQIVQVFPRRTTTVVLPRTKVPERTDELRTLGWAIGGTGLALSVASLGTYLVSSDQHAEYEREQSRLNREFAWGRANAATIERQHANDQRAQKRPHARHLRGRPPRCRGDHGRGRTVAARLGSVVSENHGRPMSTQDPVSAGNHQRSKLTGSTAYRPFGAG